MSDPFTWSDDFANFEDLSQQRENAVDSRIDTFDARRVRIGHAISISCDAMRLISNKERDLSERRKTAVDSRVDTVQEL